MVRDEEDLDRFQTITLINFDEIFTEQTVTNHSFNPLIFKIQHLILLSDFHTFYC